MSAWKTEYAPAARMLFDDKVQRFPTRTCEIVCDVSGDAPSYCIGGIRQTKGDKCRLPVADARDLANRGKCRIVEDSEKTEML